MASINWKRGMIRALILYVVAAALAVSLTAGWEVFQNWQGCATATRAEPAVAVADKDAFQDWIERRYPPAAPSPVTPTQKPDRVASGIAAAPATDGEAPVNDAERGYAEMAAQAAARQKALEAAPKAAEWLERGLPPAAPRGRWACVMSSAPLWSIAGTTAIIAALIPLGAVLLWLLYLAGLRIGRWVRQGFEA